MISRTSSSARTRALVAVVVLSLTSAESVTRFERVAHAEPSASDIASARALVAEGRKLRAAGDHKQAIVKLEAAFSLYRTPVTGHELALAYRDGSKLVEARETALAVVKMPLDKDEGKASEAARTECSAMVKDLAPRIAQLVVVITGVPEGATVSTTIDGQSVPAVALTVPRMVNPGKHVVVATVSGIPERRIELEVKEGESKTVDVVFPATAPTTTPATAPTTAKTAAPAPSAPPPPITPKPHDDVGAHGGPGWLSWVGFSVAGVGALVGTISGLSAMSTADRLERRCGSDRLCPESESTDLNSLDRSTTISTVSFVLAGVGLAVGVLDLTMGVSGTKREARATISVGLGPGSLGLSGRF